MAQHRLALGSSRDKLTAYSPAFSDMRPRRELGLVASPSSLPLPLLSWLKWSSRSVCCAIKSVCGIVRQNRECHAALAHAQPARHLPSRFLIRSSMSFWMAALLAERNLSPSSRAWVQHSA